MKISRNAIIRQIIIVFALISLDSKLVAQTSNALIVPDTLKGPVFNLNILDTAMQFFPTGPSTSTYAYNGGYLGPTLFFREGEFITLNVTNNIADTTTTHWHGMHVAAIDDGGPHSMILPGETWSPDFTILNEATTFWYHPHLHRKTAEHVYFGAAGMIIVEDANTDTLRLPKSYGVDDFPIIMQDKRFDANNLNQLKNEKIGDTIMINGTLNPFLEVPAQLVRLRLLNGSTMRAYNVGMEGNTTFQMIGSDGGLLESPIDLSRIMLAPGERAEIVIDFSNWPVGQSVTLRSYNTELPMFVQGGPGGPFSSPPNNLDNKNFDLLKFKITPPTDNPITVLSPILNKHNKWKEEDVNVTRTIRMTGGFNQIFHFNDQIFDMNHINEEVFLNDIEIWELTNETQLDAHPFHIHDVQFYILDIDGNPPPPELSGLKDVVLVLPDQKVRFITKFETFTDPIIPYMYHCHILTHEDTGMMGQFLVVENPLSVQEFDDLMITYPNPTTKIVKINIPQNWNTVKKLSIYDILGIEIWSTEQVSEMNWIDFSDFPSGTYLLNFSLKDGSIHQSKIIKN